jgi:ParB-like chromosome segregation protein Spo0J
MSISQQPKSPNYENTDDLPTVTIPIASIIQSDSPRLRGEDYNHIRMLAESEDPLPPIIVHRSTMRIIDGMHRLRAAILRGNDEIEARFFDGDDASSFVLAVRANTTHGLPLSRADRRAAAIRIMDFYPEWSDRMVASVAGIAPRTVAKLRNDHKRHRGARLGRDGRVRPVDASEGRKAAARLILENPDKSLRDIALKAGISHETARDVRSRLRRGESPTPVKNMMPAALAPAQELVAPPAKESLLHQAREKARSFEALQRDPAFRGSNSGRTLLRLLAACRIVEKHGEKLVDNVPTHCMSWLAEASYECSVTWGRLSEYARQKIQNGPA